MDNLNRSRQEAATVFDPQAFHAVLADSRMLDEIGRGVYAGDDPVARALLAYRAVALGN